MANLLNPYRHAGGDGPAGIIFNDPFVETSSDTLLDAHDPTNGGGVGDSWTEVYSVEVFASNFSRMNAQASTDTAFRSLGTTEASAGCLYTAEPSSYPSANYSITSDIVESDTADDPCILALRYQDINNMYAVEFTGASGQIHKKVSGSWSTLGASFAGVPDGSNVEFKIDGSDISFLVDDVLFRTVNDSAHTSAGKAAMGQGNVVNPNADYSSQEFDNFIITDLG